MLINENVKRILNNRGYLDDKIIEEYLSSKPQLAYDPFLLLNMKVGVDLILSKIESGEKICIYGDYDADGITSVSILYLALKQLTDNVIYYIPSRFVEGYGLKKSAIDKIKEDNVDMIITVDCGTVSFEEVEYAKKLGLDVLVTDHHNAEGRLADCLIINPKQKECKYPFKGLAGCGVAFKIVQALAKKGVIERKFMNSLLDIVAVGTIGDIVPLIDENRTIAKYGLRMINSKRRKGIEILANAIYGKNIEITAEKISFGIVPHLNAAGRIGDAKIAVPLFISEDTEVLNEVSEKLLKRNNERKRKQESAYIDCMSLIDKQCGNSKFPVIFPKEAHEGVTGIVAGKIKDSIKRPVAIVTRNGDVLKGTSRSIGKIDLYGILNSCSENLIQFGGHKAACGFTLEEKNLENLRASLNKLMEKFDGKDFVEEINIDGNLNINDTSIEFVNDLALFEPCGKDNPKPTFAINNVKIKDVYFMGEKKNHVRFNAVEGTNSISCIKFNIEEEKDKFKEKRLSVTGKLGINSFRGKDSIQFIVDEIS